MKPKSPQRCDHYDVCHVVHTYGQCGEKCDYDTRSRPMSLDTRDVGIKNGEVCGCKFSSKCNINDATIRNATIDEFKKWNPFVQSFKDFCESLRSKERP